MSKEMCEVIKKEIMGVAAMMNEQNKVVPVAGERMRISSEGRELDVVHYKSMSSNV